jgi:xylan 1,4-beta-xylosidase
MRHDSRLALHVSIILALLIAFAPLRIQAQTAETITINAQSPTRPFPHFWEQMFGSCRAVLTLRDSYRRDLRDVRRITDFKYVRFHAIFHDEVGFYDEDAQGNPVYNFSYIDQIYDGLLENNVRPFVELSFTPRKLSAAPVVVHPFWYKQLVSPPKSYERWGEMIYQFTKHLLERYGEQEVAQWYFEVWNEPNIDFWAGNPKEPTYYELYDAAARAIKRVSPRLRVGGPATAQAAWVDRFIKHCVEANAPVDFVSTHVYANDRAQDVFGTNENIPRATMVARSVRKVFDQVKASARPNLPIIWSEYNASYRNEVEVTDSPFIAAWLANNIRQCDGMADIMSYWTFSDVFEEQGVVKTPFYGGFGLIAAGHIPKISYNAFALLHRLGDARISIDSPSALATKRSDGTLAVAVWNYFEPEEAGAPKQIALRFANTNTSRVRITTLDASHGNALAAWRQMGSPAFPSREQQQQLRVAGAMPASVEQKLARDKTITLNLMPHSLALVEAVK